MVDSCRTCEYCKGDTEQLCATGYSGTYNSLYQDKKTPTYGGYSTNHVCTEAFVLKVSESFRPHLTGVAPLLCAGITTYSPLNQFKHLVENGKKVAIVGLGGLGHMGIKFAHAMGADVTVFSTTQSKEAESKKLGANHFLNSKDKEVFTKHRNHFDFILDTISAEHDVESYLHTLKPKGAMVLVGGNPKPFHLHAFTLLMSNKTLAGTLIGGVKETQEMLDFCAKHNIVSDVEVINADQIDVAYDRTVASDVKYRFVIDIESIRKSK